VTIGSDFLVDRIIIERMHMKRTFAYPLLLLVLMTGCKASPPQPVTVPEPVLKRLGQPLEHAVPYDIDTTTRLGRFLVARGYFVPWTPDRPKDIYNLDIRLSSTTSLPNGTNVPYTLSVKAKPFVRGTELRLATYRVEKVLAVIMKKQPKALRGKAVRFALKVEYQVTPLLPGMPPIKEVVASVEVDYDAEKGNVLQVAGLEKVAKAVKNAVEQALKAGR
jgi:hypothetical protein